MRIGIDIMGGDHAPEKIVQGVLLAKEEIKDKIELVLFGDKKKIENLLSIHNTKKHNFKIVHCKETITMEENAIKG